MLRACCVAKSTWIGPIEPIEFTQPFCGRFIQNTRALPYDKIPQMVDLYVETGWGGRIRTSVWRNQNPLPYHLATPQSAGNLSGNAVPGNQRARGAPPLWPRRGERCGGADRRGAVGKKRKTAGPAAAHARQQRPRQFCQRVQHIADLGD